MKIWKYNLKADWDGFSASWEYQNEIMMPKGAKILSVAVQAQQPVIWALVDPDQPKENRAVYVVSTGEDLREGFSGRRFIGTFMFGNDGIILHVFE